MSEEPVTFGRGNPPVRARSRHGRRLWWRVLFASGIAVSMAVGVTLLVDRGPAGGAKAPAGPQVFTAGLFAQTVTVVVEIRVAGTTKPMPGAAVFVARKPELLDSPEWREAVRARREQDPEGQGDGAIGLTDDEGRAHVRITTMGCVTRKAGGLESDLPDVSRRQIRGVLVVPSRGAGVSVDPALGRWVRAREDGPVDTLDLGTVAIEASQEPPTK